MKRFPEWSFLHLSGSYGHLSGYFSLGIFCEGVRLTSKSVTWMSKSVTRARARVQVCDTSTRVLDMTDPLVFFFGMKEATYSLSFLSFHPFITMPSTKFVGRVSLKHLEGDVEVLAKEMCLAFAAEGGFPEHCFVFELGDVEKEPHLHFYLETAKSDATLRRLLQKAFDLPPKAYALKKAIESKLETYFVYLAKGVNSVHGDPVKCLLENAPRLWAELHEKYHAKAQEIADSRKKVKLTGMAEWYDAIAEKCRALGKTSKEDILAECIRYYVEDSKKGFDKFAVERTFHAVFSRVNGAECKDWLYTQCSQNLFRW